jgi:glycosyltransferase involved in cell wall biosynthesis
MSNPSNKKNYLLISGSSYPTMCGVGNYAHKVANILAEKEYNVYYIANETQNICKKPTIEKIAYKLDKIQIIFKNLFKILGYIQNNKIDVVNIQYNSTELGRQLFPSFLAMLIKARFPQIVLQVTIHEFANYTKLGKIRHIIPCLVADKCFFSDTNQLNSAISFSKGAIKKKSKKIPIGSNVKFNITEKTPKIAVNGPINIVFHGLIQPKNGLEYLVRALVKLKNEGIDFRLHILGEFKLLVNYGEKNQEISDYQQSILNTINENIKTEITIHGDIDPSSELFYEILKNKEIYVAPDTDGLTVRRTSFWNVFLQSDAIAIGTYVDGISDPELSCLVNINRKDEGSIIFALNHVLTCDKVEISKIYSEQLAFKHETETAMVDKKIYELLTN